MKFHGIQTEGLTFDWSDCEGESHWVSRGQKIEAESYVNLTNQNNKPVYEGWYEHLIAQSYPKIFRKSQHIFGIKFLPTYRKSREGPLRIKIHLASSHSSRSKP
jgi:hypothetical protein